METPDMGFEHIYWLWTNLAYLHIIDIFHSLTYTVQLSLQTERPSFIWRNMGSPNVLRFTHITISYRPRKQNALNV